MSRDLKGATALMTGGTGFIGSRLAAGLARAGCRVHHFARRRTDAPAAGWHLGDARDVRAAAAAVAACDPDFVFSLAAIREGSRDLGRADLDAAAALAAALAGRSRRLRRWVRTGFRHGDGVDARMEEAWDRSVRERFRLPLVTLRLFRVYGPGQKNGDLIPSVLRQARAAREVVVPESGSVDLVHVDDVVRAYLLAAARPGAVGRLIEIGSGTLLSPGEVGRAALAAARVQKPVIAPEKAGAGSPARLEPAEKALGWRPKVSLRAGLRRLLAEWDGEGA
jgi:nucleoside-diphosphate-sugar epimerase